MGGLMKRIISFVLAFVLIMGVLISGVSAESYNQDTKIGWVMVDKTWYYVKEDGAYQTGWCKINEIWYYFNDSGAMQTGWVILGDNHYYLNEYGAMQTGWVNLDGVYYYFNENGTMKTGWLELDEGRYYLSDNGAMVKGWAVINGQKYLFDDSGKCVEGAHTFVIDISKWQGTIDWDKLKSTDVDAVILRISYGGQTTENNGDSTDTRFVEYIENLERLKIPYGVYHFNTATTVEVAKIQAQNVIGILKETGANPTFPVFADIETNGGACDLIAIAKVYMETFIANGYMPGIYANQNYWNNYLNDPELCVYYRWIANYGVNNGYPNAAFAPIDGIENYMMWQYTDKGQIDGITENTVDLNALFDWYKKPDGLIEINGKKFIYDNGYFKFGWLYENGRYTYLKPSGDMAVGWLYLDNVWYYLNEEGVMQTGWLRLGNTWYYLNEYGAMQTGWLMLGCNWYYLNEGGAMHTGWLYLNNTWYYLEQNGVWTR